MPAWQWITVITGSKETSQYLAKVLQQAFMHRIPLDLPSPCGEETTTPNGSNHIHFRQVSGSFDPAGSSSAPHGGVWEAPWLTCRYHRMFAGSLVPICFGLAPVDPATMAPLDYLGMRWMLGMLESARALRP
jgi:hypothetical protein